jgi:hypothetical protein
MSYTIAERSGVARHLANRVRAAFVLPEPEPADYPFVESDIAKLHLACPLPGEAVDDQTWSDLLLPRYLEQLSGECSIFGRQELYRRLRAGVPDQECAAQSGRVRALMQDQALLGRLHRVLRPLRGADTEIAAWLYQAQRPEVPVWAGRTWPLTLLLLASIAGVAFSPLAWLGTALALYLLIVLQVRYYERVQVWNRSAGTLQLMLSVSSQLGGEDDLAERGFAQGRQQASAINRALSRSLLARVVPGAREYADWFQLANVNHYFKCAALVFEHRAFLRECFERCATLEADVALAHHLLAASGWCWAERSDARRLALEDTSHPLLDAPAPLSITLEGKGVFISGQNGVGKSTLLRTVGLNLIAARAFGFCYARQARVPAVPVLASMHNADSLLDGESLFVAELRRARELLDRAGAGAPAIYLIDEVFRGTNHVESVSAGAAVIDTLAGHGLVIASSHHLVLAPLLGHRLDAWHIRRDAGRLALQPGVLVETNGVALLWSQGFAPGVARKAERVAHWLGAYLAAPGEAAELLDPARATAPG